MDAERFKLEKEVLERKLPKTLYMFKNMGTPDAHLIAGVLTNAKNVYTLKIMLDDFPNQVPAVFTTKPLKNHSGNDLQTSHLMHNYGTSDGKTQICYYPGDSWSPNVSLYKVYINCRFWLECYEQHLRTGRTIDEIMKEYSHQCGNEIE